MMLSKTSFGWLFALGLVTACGAPAEETLVEEGEEDVSDPHNAFLMFEGGAAADELKSSPPRTAEEAFDVIGILYESPEWVHLEISTSADGTTWSEWSELIADPDGEGAWVVDHHVTSPVQHYKVRSQGDLMPIFLSYEPGAAMSSDEDEELEAMMTVDEAAGVGETAAGLGSFKRFRFDRGKVSKPWLWLLRTARREGWTGRLAGSRTGLRTYAQQKQLWDLFQSGRGAPAFPPWGPSRHMIRNVAKRGRWYQAIDTQDVSRLIRIARRHGVRLRVPYSNEPWHVEATRAFTYPKGWNSR